MRKSVRAWEYTYAAFDSRCYKKLRLNPKRANAQQASASNGHFGFCATWIYSQCSDSTHIMCVSRDELTFSESDFSSTELAGTGFR
jgi:hypothetical protein